MSNICNEEAEYSLESSHLGQSKAKKNCSELIKRSSSEEIFRGFVKVPLVLCRRIDISPYLSKLKPTENPDIAEKMTPVTTPGIEAMAKLFNTCSVALVRDDLQRLKEEFCKRQNISTNEPHLKCKICEKEYFSEKKLSNHLENKHIIIKSPKRVSFSEHIIVHEVEEYHRCRRCTKIFKDYNNLKVHMRQNHKKRKCYICFYCHKDFVDKTFFKLHIKMHCDACGLLLPTKKQYLEHRLTVCKIVKKYDCQTCDQSFFSFMDLKDHSYDHLGIFFICDICKDQFETKCAVSHHIKFLHSKQYPKSLYKKTIGDPVMFTCNFCEVESEEQDVMEKHVSNLPVLENIVRTGYKDYYFCNQCCKKFGTETDMLHHKWSHFLKSTENSQLRTCTNGETIPEEEALEEEKINHQESILGKELNNEELIADEKCNNKKIKTSYKIGENLPEFLQPKLVLKRIEIPKKTKIKVVASKPDNFIDVTNASIIQQLSKPIIDPLSKKTILSKHKCENCGKYLSTNYCLTRHMRQVHGLGQTSKAYEDLQCLKCEEVFFWPSLLQNHRCIRANIPEMPFDDARPEIHIDNLHEISQNGDSEEDYMNCIDFEIAAPIVQLTEYENLNIVLNHGNGQLDVIENEKTLVNNMGYKVVMQEVPIEF